MKWNLFNFVYDYIFNIYYNREEKKYLLASAIMSSTITKELLVRSVKVEDIPFKDRVKGVISLEKGNGTCILQISNLTFDDKGVIILMAFETFSGAAGAIRENITFRVEGKLVKLFKNILKI